MRDDYPADELALDAAAFADSRFGKHYLKRLKDAKTRHLETAMDDTLTDSYRAHSASKAAALASEIEYFQVAKTIRHTPSMLERLRAKLKPQEDAPV